MKKNFLLLLLTVLGQSEKYMELLNAVTQKVPGQSRHQTALDLIKKAQSSNESEKKEKQ